jgi:hypothetical protein
LRFYSADEFWPHAAHPRALVTRRRIRAKPLNATTANVHVDGSGTAVIVRMGRAEAVPNVRALNNPDIVVSAASSRKLAKLPAVVSPTRPETSDSAYVAAPEVEPLKLNVPAA